ncbi:unnamed protein product [Gadus morhua 'NCC']
MKEGTIGAVNWDDETIALVVWFLRGVSRVILANNPLSGALTLGFPLGFPLAGLPPGRASPWQGFPLAGLPPGRASWELWVCWPPCSQDGADRDGTTSRHGGGLRMCLPPSNKGPSQRKQMNQAL